MRNAYVLTVFIDDRECLNYVFSSAEKLVENLMKRDMEDLSFGMAFEQATTISPDTPPIIPVQKLKKEFVVWGRVAGARFQARRVEVNPRSYLEVAEKVY